MIYILAYVKDTATEMAGPVMTFINERQAIRTLADSANSKDNNIGKHPKDYHMYKCGMYNDETGEVQALSHQLITRAEDLVKPENK